MHILQFDGMFRAIHEERSYQSGLLGYGWLIRKSGIEIAHGFGIARINSASSNAAEYLSLVEGLEALTDLRVWDDVIEVRGDARCVIDQMKGTASVSSPMLRRMKQHAQILAKRFHALTWVWVPRSENKQADKLSHRGLRYLRPAFSSSIDLQKDQPGIIHENRLMPLVDLRVHSPM
jgi:ribonuclease HI